MSLLETASVRKTIRRLEALGFAPWTFPLALLLLGIAAYGLLLPRLGFYWDDWAKISVSRLFGLSGYWAYYAGDRPLSAWTHIVLTPLLGVSPLAWQVFQLGLTLLSAWGVYWVVSGLWPRARWQAAGAALLFLVYPAFTAHAISVTFHQQWLQYALFLLSLGFMIQAFRRPDRTVIYTALSLLLSIVQLTITEYFAPLELLRPLVLWLLAGQAAGGAPRFWPRLRAALLRYLPFLVEIAVYGAYRLFFIRLTGSDPYRAVMLYNLFQHPLETVNELLRVGAQDSLYSLVSTWAGQFMLGRFTTVITPFQWAALGASLAVAAVTFYFLARFDLQESGERGWIVPALLLGAAAFLLGCLPAWITGREIVFDAHSDRYALPAIFGASLIWTALVTAVAQNRAARSALLAVLVGLGTGVQLRATNDYRWIWDAQRDFYWELSWRAPELLPGTALLTYQEVFPNQGLFSSSAALNLLYPQEKITTSLGYYWYTLIPRYHLGQFSEPINLKFNTTFRTLHFEGSTPNTLLVQFDPSYGNCLYVVTPADKNDSQLPGLVKEMSSLTNLSRIQPQPQDGWKPPEAMFGAEPGHTSWCYYFEKADLAAQFSDWQQAASLADQARQHGYAPRKASTAPQEWRPFIQAYAQVGRWQEAVDLSVQLGKRGAASASAACAVWQGLGLSLPASAAKDAALGQVAAQLSCAQVKPAQ